MSKNNLDLKVTFHHNMFGLHIKFGWKEQTKYACFIYVYNDNEEIIFNLHLNSEKW